MTGALSHAGFDRPANALVAQLPIDYGVLINCQRLLAELAALAGGEYRPRQATSCCDHFTGRSTVRGVAPESTSSRQRFFSAS